ncbi:MAG: hypothetical protein ACRD9R_03295 [Pyrinomonadaceae bacterium]
MASDCRPSRPRWPAATPAVLLPPQAALSLSGSAASLAFSSLTSTNGPATGLNLATVSGGVSSLSTNVQNPNGVGMQIQNSTASFSFGNAVVNGSAGTGVRLITNSGTIAFGDLDLTPDSGQRGLHATDNTNAVSSTSGAVNTPNASLGTLTIRRVFRNNTGAPVMQLRFRVVDVTTAPAPAGMADLRVLASTTAMVAKSDSVMLPVQGLTLEETSVQPSGGGLNSTLSAGVITLGSPLANGASINVQFLLGVEQTGRFRFLVNVEALMQ